MKGDFTRFRFDPSHQRRRVYEQQGRVAVDADANERTDIAEHLRARGIADVIGPAGGPLDGAGFAVAAAGADLAIGAGRYWLDGMLVENPAAASLLAQPHVPASTSATVLASGNPGPATPSDGIYVVVLEAWERLITAAEDDDLREPALGGPDTVCATEQVWRVRAVRAGAVGAAVNCTSNVAGLTALMAQSATMAARSALSTAAPDDCSVPADAGFRGTENQHYRVEIHDGGSVGTATFKWSRENGSVVTRWVGRNGSELTVSSPGRDGALGFAADDWVELIDEGRELSGLPGTLVQLAEAEGNRLVVEPGTATGTLDFADFPRAPRVRRWDSDGRPAVEVPGGNAGWIPLELGVEVRWPATATFRTGQWWSVPARTALDDVIWPAPGGTPSQLPPFGDRHRFARLAVATFEEGAWTVHSDCRELFPPLTGLETISMLGGDGQEALPDVANPAALVTLGEPLQVGVSNGGTPVAGATVLFTVSGGNGQVNGTSPSVPVATSPAGVAEVEWSVDSSTADQTVTATLLDDGGNAVHLPVRFVASLSRATQVAYDPGDCADLAGVTTVAEALDRLCQLDGEGCATIVLAPGPEWYAPLVDLPEGADATVCFQPGRYTIQEPVVVARKGNLVLTGAGRGSVVVAEESEVALRFVDCEQVVVRDLAVAAQRVVAEGGRPGLNGALTIEGCPHVLVESCFLGCAAGSRRAATCLTVRANEDRRPDSVCVRGCDFLAGHLQLGVLVLDARVSEVRGNRLQVAPKPSSLSFDALVADPARQKALASQLLARAVAADEGDEPRSGLTTRLRAGGYTLAFNSPVPAAEWQALADRNPPGEEDVGSKAALQRWASGLAGQALESPSGLPTFNRQVTSLRRRIGATEFEAAIGTEAGRALLQSNLIASDIQVIDPAGRGGTGGKTVSIGSGRVFFDSVLTEGEWMQLLRAGGITQAVDGAELKRAMLDLARMAVVDSALRDRVPAVARWWGALALKNPSVAWAGIVVAGGVAQHVVIADNDLIGVREAVHVGLSAGGLRVPGSDRHADKVHIRGNRAVLRVPLELQAGPRGYFVGNGRHIRIVANEMTVEGTSTGPAFQEGIRVWGSFGARLAIDDNLLAGCAIGVRVRPQPNPPAVSRWSVSGNVAPQAGSAVAAPASVIRTGNVP